MERTIGVMNMNILEIFNPLNSTIIVGGLTGFMIGYFIRKIIKVILFALGGVLSLIMYLQYQGLISVNVDKVQYFTDTITNSIANSTNILLHSGNKFTIIPFWIPDLSIPFTGSMAAGITGEFMRDCM
jgi:uncharacterized membrane protein (Fun14 family)